MADMLRTRWRDARSARRQDAIFREVWANFRSFPTLADGRHDTPEWRSHSGRFIAAIVRVPIEVLQPSLAGLRSTLASYPFVRQHPDHFLHIMVQELGFLTEEPDARDQITQARLDEFVGAGQSSLQGASPFAMRIGGANAFRDSVFLDARDRGELSRVHGALHDLAAVPIVPQYAYLPHVTVAHFVGEVPPADLPAALARWRDSEFGILHVYGIEVVAMSVDTAYPCLETIAVMPLGERPSRQQT